MIVHNVLFKLKDHAHVEETAAKLRTLAGKIAELRYLEVGVDQLATPRSFHISLTTKFDSWEDLATYRDHPEHLPIVEYIQARVEQAAVVDYEVP